MKIVQSLAAALAVLSLGCMAHQQVAQGPAAPGALAASAVPARPAAQAAPVFGTVDFTVSCTAPAQQQFNLAVGALHSFFYPETVKAFTRVLELDPGCAMAYWGIARSQLPNPLVQPFPPGTFQRGREAVAKGLALAPATARERDWLEAMGTYYEGPDDVPFQVRIRRYEQAMAQLSQAYPEDAEAAVFHALALLESADPHDRSYDSQFQAAQMLRRLEPGHPNHPGITHYLIHAYDYSPIAGQGLAAANAYARIAPSAPHALHMPSHIYSMLGMWKSAIDSDQAALAVAQAYAASHFPPGTTFVGEAHSLDFEENAYLQLGMDGEAAAVKQRAQAITRTNVPSIAVDTALAAIPVRYALERSAWAEAADLPPRPSAYPYAEAIRRFGRALGAARLGDPGRLPQARADLDRMAELQAMSLARPDQAYWAEQTEVLITGASGWLARAAGDDTEALRLLRRAADLEDASEKHVAMENRLCPMREQLGDLLLELQEPELALAEYEASLQSTPGRLHAISGAARAAQLAGLPSVSGHYLEQLRSQTRTADGQRPEIEAARATHASAR